MRGWFPVPVGGPGSYEVSATLASFSPQKFSDVIVGLGQIKRARLRTGACGRGGDRCQVTAESPLVDVKQSARQTNIRAEQIELLPQRPRLHDARDAGARCEPGSQARRPLDRRRERRREPLHHRRHRDHQPSERHLGQEPDRRLRRRGAGQVERLHRRVRRRDGRRHQRRDQERHEQLPRQRRCSTSRATRCDAAGQPSVAAARMLDQLRDDRPNTSRIPKDDETRIEPGFSLGGPIALNRAWFFGAYQPALTSTTRDVDAASSGKPGANAASVEIRRSRRSSSPAT